MVFTRPTRRIFGYSGLRRRSSFSLMSRAGYMPVVGKWEVVIRRAAKCTVEPTSPRWREKRQLARGFPSPRKAPIASRSANGRPSNSADVQKQIARAEKRCHVALPARAPDDMRDMPRSATRRSHSPASGPWPTHGNLPWASGGELPRPLEKQQRTLLRNKPQVVYIHVVRAHHRPKRANASASSFIRGCDEAQSVGVCPQRTSRLAEVKQEQLAAPARAGAAAGEQDFHLREGAASRTKTNIFSHQMSLQSLRRCVFSAS
jgi:hypothetical protein